ncbi:unnamed protein product [Haemonchus placei]|uniref:CARD domain-containing protein n=1 Tax=Haemonchus placei TaxID=6290 RepID=A0A0N4WNV5_HAEPC|nr:unnamed protein product [Haemonchus placei]
MSISCSRSLADIRAGQADNLDRLRSTLETMNLKDLVPILVARNVLKSHEMGAAYAKESTQAQVDALIGLLKTKNHWVGPMTDALIRNRQAPVAKLISILMDKG